MRPPAPNKSNSMFFAVRNAQYILLSILPKIKHTKFFFVEREFYYIYNEKKVLRYCQQLQQQYE